MCSWPLEACRPERGALPLPVCIQLSAVTQPRRSRRDHARVVCRKHATRNTYSHRPCPFTWGVQRLAVNNTTACQPCGPATAAQPRILSAACTRPSLPPCFKRAHRRMPGVHGGKLWRVILPGEQRPFQLQQLPLNTSARTTHCPVAPEGAPPKECPAASCRNKQHDPPFFCWPDTAGTHKRGHAGQWTALHAPSMYREPLLCRHLFSMASSASCCRCRLCSRWRRCGPQAA